MLNEAKHLALRHGSSLRSEWLCFLTPKSGKFTVVKQARFCNNTLV